MNQRVLESRQGHCSVRNEAEGTLSGGEQQMLAIGRGLMAVPRILMLDEPSLGLSPLLADFIFDAIKNMREKLKGTSNNPQFVTPAKAGVQ